MFPNHWLTKKYPIFAPMKYLALLLSIYIFTLASTPMWNMFDLVSEVVCCLDSCSDHEEEQADPHQGDCGENCNPFQSCQCCLGFIPSENQQLTRTFTLFVVRNDLFQSPVSNPVVLPVWHPPKG